LLEFPDYQVVMAPRNGMREHCSATDV